MEATNVRVLKSIFIEKTGLTYEKGKDAVVPLNIAKKHEKSGHMKILPGKPEETPKGK